MASTNNTRLPMPMPMSAIPLVPASASAYDDESDNDDDDDDDGHENAVTTTTISTSTTTTKPKMVSRAMQAGGVDQATQTDLPCLRCMHGPPQHYYSPQHYYNHHQPPVYPPPHQPQYYPQQYYLPQHHPQQYPPPPTHPYHIPQHSQPPQHAATPPTPSQPPPLEPRTMPVFAPPAPAPPPPPQRQQQQVSHPLQGRHPQPNVVALPAAPVHPPSLVRPLSPLPGPPSWDKMVLRRTWQNLQDAENDIKNFAEFLGFALVRRRSGNRDPDTGKPTRIHYCCHLDAARKPAIAPEDRKRKRESAASITKRDEPCPWQICLKWNKRRGTQPHLFRLWHLVWTGGADAHGREHNHDMDPDPANIPANRRRHFTDDIKEEITTLLAEGGQSSSQIVDLMKKRHPRIDFTKNMVDNQRRVVLARREAAAAGASATSGQIERGGSGDDNDDDKDEDDDGGDEDEEMEDSMANATGISVAEA